MDRRLFLKASGFFSVSVAGGMLSACGGSSGNTEVATTPSTSDLSLVTGSNWKFPQSVASGDPRADSIVLWTRATASSLDAGATVASGSDGAIRLLVSSSDHTAALGSNSALTGTMVLDTKVALKAAYDNTIRHKVTGLQPGQTYFYQFIAGEVRSKIGRFKTAPAASAAVDKLQFAYLTCQDWSVNHWGAFDYIAQQETLDFIVHLGDYIYETVGADFQKGEVEARHTPLSLPDGTVLVDADGKPGKARYATTLNDYRYLYKMYRSDERLQAVHERFAFIAIWDDHEFSDDAWQDAATYENNSQDKTGEHLHQTSRRRAANQAWFEFMPADVNFDEANTSFQNIKLYRDFQFGQLMSLVMTDQRLYRSDHVIPENLLNPATGKPINSSTGTRYIVPQDLYNALEAQKITTAKAMTSDPLAYTSILGKTQRDWWQEKMANAKTTWKLWGNEVSLLRMGLNGTDAIATLIALASIKTLATTISTALTNPALGGNVLLAASIVAASTAGASSASATNAAGALLKADGANGLSVLTGAGLSTPQAGITLATYNAAKAAAAAGSAAQIGAAAQTIAFGYIKADVQTNKQNSSFVVASGQQAALAPFFTRFFYNCDQWDGYNAERKALMQFLSSNKISNVVALTGDIHSFFAGTVQADFDVADSPAVMVDLVSAGVSSDSFYSYLKAGAGSTGLASIIFYPLTIPVPNLGDVTISVNMLDYTMGKAAPTLDGLLEQVRMPLTAALSSKGVPEGAQLSATVSAILAALKANSDFNTSLLGLAQQLAGLGNNPWLKHLNTDAQGYTVVSLSAGKLNAQFKQVNRLVSTGKLQAPANVIARVTQVSLNAGSTELQITTL